MTTFAPAITRAPPVYSMGVSFGKMRMLETKSPFDNVDSLSSEQRSKKASSERKESYLLGVSICTAGDRCEKRSVNGRGRIVQYYYYSCVVRSPVTKPLLCDHPTGMLDLYIHVYVYICSFISDVQVVVGEWTSREQERKKDHQILFFTVVSVCVCGKKNVRFGVPPCEVSDLSSCLAERTRPDQKKQNNTEVYACECVGVYAVRLNDNCYLVDPVSSHMLVSKIKPCMSKYKQVYCETYLLDKKPILPLEVSPLVNHDNFSNRMAFAPVMGSIPEREPEKRLPHPRKAAGVQITQSRHGEVVTINNNTGPSWEQLEGKSGASSHGNSTLSRHHAYLFDHYLEKIRVFKAGTCPNRLAWNNEIRCRGSILLESGDVILMTCPALYGKPKFLGSRGSMVTRLKLKGIDGRAPPGVEPLFLDSMGGGAWPFLVGGSLSHHQLLRGTVARLANGINKFNSLTGSIAIIALQRGISSKHESSVRADYVPALLRPSDWRWVAGNSCAFAEKLVSVGEPAKRSLMKDLWVVEVGWLFSRVFIYGVACICVMRLELSIFVEDVVLSSSERVCVSATTQLSSQDLL
ncbi:hypothetical protein G9A89_013053 [Geosiphon pyriformis]|nr:hypothetical protein G9A89_013053 [Geosiphon pyriformis]